MSDKVSTPEKSYEEGPEKKEKIVNLFEDTGNFHDEEELKKSYDRVPESEKK